MGADSQGPGRKELKQGLALMQSPTVNVVGTERRYPPEKCRMCL